MTNLTTISMSVGKNIGSAAGHHMHHMLFKFTEPRTGKLSS